MGEELIPKCKFDKEGLLVCNPQLRTRDGVVTTKTPIKVHVDSAGNMTLVDSGDAPDYLLEKTLEHIKKNIIIKK